MMRFLSFLSLAFKLSLVLSLIVAAVAAAIGGAMVDRDRQRLREELRGRALLLARSVAVTAPESLLRGDSWTLYKMLRQLTLGPDDAQKTTLVAAMVLDPEGRVLAHINPALYPIGLPLLADGSPERPRLQSELGMKDAAVVDGQGYMEGVSPVQASGKNIGLVRVRLSTLELDRETATAGASMILLSVGIALSGIVLGSIWSIRTLRPLHTLARSMEDLGRGVINPLPVSRGDEIGQLIASFNRMASELEEKRRLESELAANEKVIALGRIAAGVAHEVNNPLAGMLNCLSTLRARSNDPELVARYLPMIEKGLQKIEALVKDLLIELRVDGAHEVADSSCLEDVRDLITAEIDPSRIEFAWDNGLQPGDCLNRPRVQQVLLNLLHNSIQAMPNGGRLGCRFRSDHDMLVFEVEDTGHGIRAEDLGHIFDPFFTSRPTGTGLGLWIVLRLVQSMNGSIDVDSLPGQGTQFRIHLPREPQFATRQA
jgi:two-component system, NtrC family, sensor kinase